MNFFKPNRETWIHRVNPAFKFVILFSVLIVALVNRQLDFAMYQMVIYLSLFVLLCGYSWKKTLLFLAPFIIVFISSSFTLMLFGRGTTVWWEWGLIKVTEESFHHGLLVGFKTVSFGVLGLFFALTSKPIMFFYAMMQQFRLPPKYGYSFIASIRIFPLVWEDFHHRTNALKVRGARFSRGFRGVYERLSVYAVPLLVQSIRRAQRVAVAMEAKRFQIGAERTFYYMTRLTKLDLLYGCFIVVLVVIAFGLSQFVPLFGR